MSTAMRLNRRINPPDRRISGASPELFLKGINMERRDFITTIGAASAALFGMMQSARAEDKAGSGHEGHHAAAQEHVHPAKYKALTDAAAKCVVDGENNLRHCFEMVAMKDTTMAECIKLTHDTIAACRALESLAAVNSPFTPAMAKVVEQVCSACKKECDKFLQFAECKAMAESCDACSEQCRKA